MADVGGAFPDAISGVGARFGAIEDTAFVVVYVALAGGAFFVMIA